MALTTAQIVRLKIKERQRREASLITTGHTVLQLVSDTYVHVWTSVFLEAGDCQAQIQDNTPTY